MEKVFSVDDEAADSDEAFLEHAKPKAYVALKNVLFDGDAAAEANLKACKELGERFVGWPASQ